VNERYEKPTTVNITAMIKAKNSHTTPLFLHLFFPGSIAVLLFVNSSDRGVTHLFSCFSIDPDVGAINSRPFVVISLCTAIEENW
jgi:hypothetical protein